MQQRISQYNWQALCKVLSAWDDKLGAAALLKCSWNMRILARVLHNGLLPVYDPYGNKCETFIPVVQRWGDVRHELLLKQSAHTLCLHDMK